MISVDHATTVDTDVGFDFADWTAQPARGRRSARRIAVPVFVGVLRIVDLAVLLLASIAVCMFLGIVHVRHGLHILPVLIANLVTIVTLTRVGAYRIARLRNHAVQAVCLLFAVLAGFGALDLALFLSANMRLAKEPFPEVWAGCMMLTLCATHGIGGMLVRHWSANGRLRRNIVLIGANEQSEALIKGVNGAANTDLHVVGIYDDEVVTNTVHAGVPVVGRVSDLLAHGRDGAFDAVVIAGSLQESSRLKLLCDRLSSTVADIYLMTDLVGRSEHLFLSAVCDRVVVLLRRRPLDDWQIIQKAVFDRVGSLAMIVLLSPVMLALALAVRLSGPGPIIFQQVRVGFNNKPFLCLKFRSMHHHACDGAVITQATRHDPRVTPIGRILRKASLDELPQLFNVLRGDMSLVGPRPHAPTTKAGDRYFQDIATDYAVRHRVKPGITGWAQVNGWRGETRTTAQLRARVDHDIHYIANWSILLDIKILLLTLKQITGKTAF